MGEYEMLTIEPSASKLLRITTLCCASFAAIATDAAAQDAPRQFAGLEEIVVTARRTAENVQSVPMTVNVLTADAIENKGLANFANVNGLVPNVVWSDSGGGTYKNKLTIRGIFSGASDYGFDPGIGIYLDDVYVGAASGFNSALLDIDRIEVLKGPQGTLFGRNTTAGAISLHTRRPSVTESYTEANLRAGSYNLFEGRFMTSQPLSDTTALKFSGIYRDRDGYQRNAVSGRRDLNNDHYYGGRMQFLWAPSSDFDLLASADYYKNEDKQDILSCRGAPFCTDVNPTRDSVYDDIAADNNTTSNRAMWSASLHATWRATPNLEVASITAYRHLDAFIDQDQDFSPVEVTRSGIDMPKDWQLSQELRIAAGGDGPLRGVAGVYYFKEDREVSIPFIIKGPVVASFGGANADMVQLTSSQQQTSSWAVFGQGSWDVTSHLTGELGLRYTRDSKDFTYEQTENDVVATLPPSLVNAIYLIPYPRASGSDSWSETTGTASLTWSFTDEIRAYARYSRGYKSGGFQMTTNSAGLLPTRPFGPEILDQYEIGLKTELLEHRLRVNLAAFQMKYDDIQVQITNDVTRQKFVTNLGSAQSEGAELEFTAVVLDGWTIDGNVGRQRPKFTSGPSDGKTLRYAPKTTASLSTNFDYPLWSGWRGSFSATGVYRASMFLNTSATFASPEVTTVNARLGFQQEHGPWGVYLWGDNLGDSRRFVDFVNALPTAPEGFHISTPRTYGVELQARF
jgi:iron complex outermembrane recepter protein